MADDTNGGDPDQELLEELRRVLGEVDPVPPEATAYAKAALGWRRIDADLAELLGDSVLESEALAGTRSASAGARTLTFRADALELDLEISVDEETGLVLLGQLAPATVARIEVQRDDGSVAAETEADELGRFRVVLAAGGRIRLRIVPAGHGPGGVVETSWFAV